MVMVMGIGGGGANNDNGCGATLHLVGDGGANNVNGCGATLQLGADVAAAAAGAGLQRTARNAQPWPAGGCCAMIAVPDSSSPAVDPGALILALVASSVLVAHRCDAVLDTPPRLAAECCCLLAVSIWTSATTFDVARRK